MRRAAPGQPAHRAEEGDLEQVFGGLIFTATAFQDVGDL